MRGSAIVKKYILAVLALTLFATAAQAGEETVTLQVVKSMAQAPYYIALAKGYFAAEGIEVDAADVRSALDTVGPMATGRLDASMGAATAAFFDAAHRGFEVRIAAVMALQGPVMATQPLVRRDLWDNGMIKNAGDYRGRKVAVNAPGDITEYFLTLMLQKYGLQTRDVELTPMGFALQFVAFKNSAIDAGFLPEPIATAAKKEGRAAFLAPEGAIGAGTPTNFLFLGTHFIRERPQTALAFVRALVRGARDAQGDYHKQPDLAQIIAQQTGLTIADVTESTPFLIDPDLDIAKYAAALQNEEAVHRRNGRLDYAAPLDISDIIDASLVHAAAASLR